MAVHNMKMACFFFVAFVCFLTRVHQAQPSSNSISDLTFKNMDFAMNLYRKISSYHDKNIFFSPLSISTSFAALLMASDGVTHKEILKVLKLEELERADQPDLIPKLFQLLHENITHNGSLRLDQSTALFMQPQFAIETDFKDKLKVFFNADVKSVNFADAAGSISVINNYIRDKTRGKVTEVISALDEGTKLLLINTIFFQGAWQMPFNANLTRNAPFYIDNYNTVQVPMMFKEDKFYYADVVDAKVLKLPYHEGVSMLVLLPNTGTDYTMVDDEITAEKFQSWIRKLRKIKLEVNMPKFNMEQSYSLHNLLPDMGMISAFSSLANLTKLSQDKGLKLSEVLHKAVIEVDEIGTTAAAATTIGIIPYSLPRTFTVNRPFFFFIYHEETNCLLFMGRVIDPTRK